MWKWLWTQILKLAGWKIIGNFPSQQKKAIIVVGPHTSNWDFFYGFATRAIQQFPSYFLIKDDWTNLPIVGAIIRAVGGVGVDRSKQKKVSMSQQTIEKFNELDEFVIAITPEGTRNYNDNWRTGFWHIAKEANVPLVPASFDYPTKRIIWNEPFYTSNSKEQDIEKLKAIFRQYQGKIPENGVV